MITIQQATSIINNNQISPSTEVIPLNESLGKILCEDISANEPSPRFTNSAMDGYAINWNDLNGHSNNEKIGFNIIGESQAGIPFNKSVKPMEAIRISTGAMLPNGTDTVIKQEEVTVEEDKLIISNPPKQYGNVRFEGEDIKIGEEVLNKGSLINPPQMALLASLGTTQVKVFRKPNVSIIVTGEELASFNETMKKGQIRDSNRIMLEALIDKSGGKVNYSGKVNDNLRSTIQSIHEASRVSDIIIISGGVSVGPHDHVKEAAKEAGFTTLLWEVSQKPGKPLFVARKNNTILFGLPGNPVAVFSCYLYYVHSYIQNLQGSFKSCTGKIEKTVVNNGNRSQFLWASLKTNNVIPIICPLEKQNSHMLSAISEADGFLIINGNSSFEKDRQVEIHLFPWDY